MVNPPDNLHIQSLINDIHIAQGHVLCAIRMESGTIAFAAAPLSLIFAAVKSSTTGKKPNSSSPVLIQSEAVFIHVLPLALPEAVHGSSVNVSVVFTSVCTDSWRCPSLHEFDAVGFTTRILLFVYLYAEQGEGYCMVNHLEFSPITKLNSDRASRTIGSANASDYILTCQRQSPLYSVDDDEDETNYRWEASSRTGRVVGMICDYADNPEHICAIDLNDLLERPVRESGPNESGTDFETVAQPEHDLTLLCKKLRRPRSIDALLYKLNLDEYSGALWYLYGRSVYIRFFE